MFHSLKNTPPSRAELLCLGILTLAAACTQFYGLDRQSLWFDEICGWHTATHDSLIDVALAGRLFLMSAWLLLPFIFAYTKSVFSASIFTHRNLSVSLPAMYLPARCSRHDPPPIA